MTLPDPYPHLHVVQANPAATPGASRFLTVRSLEWSTSRNLGRFDAAAFAGVTVKTVRHYHRLGLVDEPARDSSGYRRYHSGDLLRLVQVRTLAAAGVPLAGIPALLDAQLERLRAEGPAALVAGAAAFLAIIAHVFVGATTVDVTGTAPGAAWIAIPLTIGIARRLIGESQARERAETQRRKLDDERLRLATEVHDIVGHGLAAIQMQADIALHIADSKPDQARIALQAISTASAAALSELRTTLRSITPETARGNTSDLRAPTPGLARVDDLCRRIRAAGVHVDLVTTGPARPIPPAIDVAAYRIVQESLTNVVRHAAARRATVRIDYLPDAVSVVVISPHDGTTPDEGFGIHGMRRRIEQVGGDFTIDSGDTVEVRALLPAGADADQPA